MKRASAHGHHVLRFSSFRVANMTPRCPAGCARNHPAELVLILSDVIQLNIGGYSEQQVLGRVGWLLFVPSGQLWGGSDSTDGASPGAAHASGPDHM